MLLLKIDNFEEISEQFAMKLAIYNLHRSLEYSKWQPPLPC